MFKYHENWSVFVFSKVMFHVFISLESQFDTCWVSPNIKEVIGKQDYCFNLALICSDAISYVLSISLSDWTYCLLIISPVIRLTMYREWCQTITWEWSLIEISIGLLGCHSLYVNLWELIKSQQKFIYCLIILVQETRCDCLFTQHAYCVCMSRIRKLFRWFVNHKVANPVYTSAVTNPNRNKVSCRISDPDPIIHKIWYKT